jgi:cytochrome c6
MNSKLIIATWSLGLISASISQSALALDLLRGQRLYNMHCAVCHGLNGVPVIQQAPSFVAKERLMQPDMMLVQSVKMGKTIMPPFMGILKDEEILDVLNYARTLR